MIVLRWTGVPRRWPVVVEPVGGGMSVYGQNRCDGRLPRCCSMRL
jgi:hypothetical protein